MYLKLSILTLVTYLNCKISVIIFRFLTFVKNSKYLKHFVTKCHNSIHYCHQMVIKTETKIWIIDFKVRKEVFEHFK